MELFSRPQNIRIPSRMSSMLQDETHGSRICIFMPVVECFEPSTASLARLAIHSRKNRWYQLCYVRFF